MDEMEALGRIMREELGIKPLETKVVKKRKNEDCENHKKYESKIVNEKRLLSYVDEGWEIIREVKNGKLAIRRELQASNSNCECWGRALALQNQVLSGF